MKISIVTISVSALFASAAHGQQYQYFGNSYAAARGSAGDIAATIGAQRNTEAIVNEMRAARGLPPCSIGLLGQLAGRPRC